MHDLVSAELADDPTIDITTIGRRSGEPRRIEIWMVDADGRYFLTGTTGRRDWLANLRADPRLLVHLKRRAGVTLEAVAHEVIDSDLRRHVFAHANAAWYVGEEPIEVLVAEAPMVEVDFSPSGASQPRR